ncbi:hypothetical protein HDU83_008308 [Entophlyctis luteolus]|nr:hypothetical protein HDU83_008308 [Entophlyctis luteolus]
MKKLLLSNTNAAAAAARRANAGATTGFRSLWHIAPRSRTIRSPSLSSSPSSVMSATDSSVDPFVEMDRRFNALFNDLMRPSSLLSSRFFDGPAFAPALPSVDISETDKAYILTADLPGMKKEDVNITIKNDTLTISGERKEESEEKTEVRHMVERRRGSFTRSMAIPPDADADSIKAAMENGVLRVEIAKKPVPPEEASKKIEIE